MVVFSQPSIWLPFRPLRQHLAARIGIQQYREMYFGKEFVDETVPAKIYPNEDGLQNALHLICATNHVSKANASPLPNIVSSESVDWFITVIAPLQPPPSILQVFRVMIEQKRLKRKYRPVARQMYAECHQYESQFEPPPTIPTKQSDSEWTTVKAKKQPPALLYSICAIHWWNMYCIGMYHLKLIRHHNIVDSPPFTILQDGTDFHMLYCLIDQYGSGIFK